MNNTTSNNKKVITPLWNTVPSAVRRWDPESQWFPALDITKTAEDYVIQVDIPGLEPQDITVTADEGILFIRGTRPTLLRGGTNMLVERPSGPFIRRLALPDDAHFAGMTTFFHNGVMELRLPRTLQRQTSLEGVTLAA